MIPAVLRCTCPRCHGKTYDDISEYLGEHQGVEVRSHEVSLIAPRWVQHQTFVADLENGEQVLVDIWPEDRSSAQIAFRPNHHETWGPPHVLRDAS